MKELIITILVLLAVLSLLTIVLKKIMKKSIGDILTYIPDEVIFLVIGAIIYCLYYFFK
jgi:uncharacterized protein involved in cysteine biosynthesis